MQMCFFSPVVIMKIHEMCFKVDCRYWNEDIIYLYCNHVDGLLIARENSGLVLGVGAAAGLLLLRGNNHTVLFGWFLTFSIVSIL